MLDPKFSDGDLIWMWSVIRREPTVGLVIDADPSEGDFTMYLVSFDGQVPYWFYEDEIHATREEVQDPRNFMRAHGWRTKTVDRPKRSKTVEQILAELPRIKMVQPR